MHLFLEGRGRAIVSRLLPDSEIYGSGLTELLTAGSMQEKDYERVVVLAGMGAVEADAGPACRELAAKAGGLLATTLPARGLFHDDPFCIGISGSFTPPVGLEYLAEADLVIAVGCSLAFHAGGGGQLWPKADTLQIDIDPVGVSQGQEVARHHLRADARLGVEALTADLPARKQKESYSQRVNILTWFKRKFTIQNSDQGKLEPHFSPFQEMIMSGYTGKLLRVNLTTSEITTESIELISTGRPTEATILLALLPPSASK